MKLKPYFEMMRFSYWMRNILVIPGIIGAIHESTQSFKVFNLILGLLAICFAASANYVINGWLDRKSDSHHPQKCQRPAVTGKVSLQGIAILYLILLLASLLLAFSINQSFLIWIICFLFLSLVYNVKPFKMKERVIADLLVESMNNPLRLIMGWSIVLADSIPNLTLIFSYWLTGIFLMSAKRLAEYRHINNKIIAKAYRASFASYSESILLKISAISAILACFSISLFLNKNFWLIPLIALSFLWYLIISLKENSTAQSPEKIYKETPFFIYILGLFLLSLFSV